MKRSYLSNRYDSSLRNKIPAAGKNMIEKTLAARVGARINKTKPLNRRTIKKIKKGLRRHLAAAIIQQADLSTQKGRWIPFGWILSE